MAHNPNTVRKVYKSVIDEVIKNVREPFLNDGVDEQVLQELKQIWESKVSQSRAVEVGATEQKVRGYVARVQPQMNLARQPMSGAQQPVTVAHQQVGVTRQPVTVSVAHHPVGVTHQQVVSGIHQPVNVAHQPVTAAHQPVTAAHQHVGVPRQPVTVSVAHHPVGVTHQQVVSGIHQPVNVAHQPVNVTRQPVNVAHQPVNVTRQPVNVAHQPVAVAHQPVSQTHQQAVSTGPGAHQSVSGTHQQVSVTHHTQPVATTVSSAALSAPQQHQYIQPGSRQYIPQFTQILMPGGHAAQTISHISEGPKGNPPPLRPAYHGMPHVSTIQQTRTQQPLQTMANQRGMTQQTSARPSVIIQVDGPNDSDSEDDDDDDFNEFGQDDDNGEDKPEEDSEPLNSEDDGSDEDTSDLFDTDNVVVCQFDRITRCKNKWKFHLKDGIMNLNGKDYVFQKATGDAEW